MKQRTITRHCFPVHVCKIARGKNNLHVRPVSTAIILRRQALSFAPLSRKSTEHAACNPLAHVVPMFTLPSTLSILFFCFLCSPHSALAQTQSFPELPPPAAYPDGVFFSPNTSTATAQVLKAGETLTIRWGTNFEKVDLQLVAGEYWDSPLELAGEYRTLSSVCFAVEWETC